MYLVLKITCVQVGNFLKSVYISWCDNYAYSKVVQLCGLCQTKLVLGYVNISVERLNRTILKCVPPVEYIDSE